MPDTAISWTHRPGTRGRTWNPIRGCSRVSEGCMHCYAERTAGRFSGPGKPYEGLVRITKQGARWTGDVRLVPEHLADPLRWREPSTVFVNSMSDLFHEALTNDQIAAVFGVMAACPQHTFQALTKRAKRMREWFRWAGGCVDMIACRTDDALEVAGMGRAERARVDALIGRDQRAAPWPLPNVWLGCSVENQAAADERIPELLATPAAVRFLSCEPLLGPLDLTHRAPNCALVGATARRTFRTNGGRDEAAIPAHLRPPPTIDWVIAGCESGPGARPCDVAWLRSLRDQCVAAGVPYFLKQAVEGGGSGCAITIGPGSKRKAGGVIELPYLYGVQHASFPEVCRG
jgi:protein gp37